MLFFSFIERMRNVLFSLFCGLCCLSLSAQEYTTPGAFRVFPVDTVGVVLLETQLLQNQNKTSEYLLRYIRLNTELKEVWNNYFPFTQGFSLKFQKITNEEITLLFSSKNGRQYELLRANTAYGDYVRTQYEFSGKFEPAEVAYYYNDLWVSGTINANPVVFKLKDNNTYETLPVGISGRVKSIAGLQYDQKRKALHYTMVGEFGGNSVLIWRAMDIDGKMLKNVTSAAFDDQFPESIEVTYDGLSAAYAVGTFKKGSSGKSRGFYFARLSEDPILKFGRYKDFPSAIGYKRLKTIEKQGFDKAKTVKTGTANKLFIPDRFVLLADGKLQFSFEVYGQEYRNRGQLEQQIIARDRTAQIDLNTYGRRDFDQTGPDLAGRIDRMSATNQTQMRFMDQTLAKAVAQGIAYKHTGYMQLDLNLNLAEEYGLFFELIKQGQFTGIPNLFDHEFIYADGHELLRFNVDDRSVTRAEANMNSYLIQWTSDANLEIVFEDDPPQIKLFSRPIRP
jgi:hypothetical protein